MTKKIKYAVFSKKQLLNMVKHIDRKAVEYNASNPKLKTLDENGEAVLHSTIVLHFHMAGQKWTGQLRPCDNSGNHKGWMT